MDKFKTTAIDSVTYVKDAVSKVRSQEWAEPAGKAMGATASIFSAFTFVPGMGIIGGALKIGSSILNPTATVHDLNRLEKEMVYDFRAIKEEIKQSAQIMSKDMMKIQSDLSDVKDMTSKTYNLVLNSSYKEGIDRIDAAFETYISGSHNLEKTLDTLHQCMFDLQTNARISLSPEKIMSYLDKLKESDPPSVEEMFHYAIATKGKFLLISCAYYIFREDAKRVGDEFQRFNEDFHKLRDWYTNFKEANAQIGKCLSYGYEIAYRNFYVLRSIISKT